MGRSSGGTTCPRCKQYARLIDDGRRLGGHRTEFYVIGQKAGGRRRERCLYSGGTWEDAKAGIPPLRRLTIDRLHAKEARGETLTESERRWLDEREVTGDRP